MDNKNMSDIISEGGEINLIDIAALAIATILFISQGDEEVLRGVGKIADVIKESIIDSQENKDESDTPEQEN